MPESPTRAEFGDPPVVVKRRQGPSGPIWKWRTERKQDAMTIHHEIQWMEADGRWLRRQAITDEEEDGGFTRYAVFYSRAYDEEEAWNILVEEVFEVEIGPLKKGE